MRTYQETAEYLEEENVKFIRLAFFDAFGRQKNIAIMPGELRRAMEGGISFDASAVSGFAGDYQSDLFLRPDPDTISIVPWRPVDGRVTRMFCDVVNPDGTVNENDTRYLLKKAVRQAEQAGIHINCGTEIEFYVFRRDENGNQTRIPLDQAGYMDIDPEDKGDNIRREICFSLIEMGIIPEASHHEQGPGQNEIDFRYASPLKAADNTSTFKWAVKSIADSTGNWADFSPKPLHDHPGNGMHVNFSVKSDDGKDPFSAFMAGILKRIREITLFLNPLRESYERFGKMEAPLYVSWSRENRSQLIRIPAVPVGEPRFELRSADPCANPYLALYLLIEAGLEGIEENLDPGESMDFNLYQAQPGVTAQIQKLPEQLGEAMQLALYSDFVKKYVPEKILAAYCDPARR